MKKLIFSFIFTLLISVGFVSCSHDFDFGEVQKENYAKTFNQVFNVEPEQYKNHQWGMNIVPLEIINSNETRAAQPNSNQWGTHDDNDKYLDWPKPADITPEELAAVLEVFNKKGEESYTDLLNLSDFFVQQVYCGPNGNKMNQLACVTNWEQVSYWPVQWSQTSNYKDDEVNNFNAGKYSGNSNQGCMLMWYSSTSEWSFKTSQSGGQRIYGHWRMEEINGNYYVGLDHEAWRQAPANANEEDKRDYIYNDWIIKIVPGNGWTPPVPPVGYVRIMAEDLGAEISDFDYNDVVFDVKFIKDGSQYTADIILQAAGGTLPLTIGNYEVHEQFGVSTDIMVNTYPGRHDEYGTRHFTVTLPNSNYNNAWDAINDLPVVVQNSNGQTIRLTVNPGQPAEMIAVSTSADWSNEKNPIKNTYPAFVNWITDSSIQWWVNE